MTTTKNPPTGQNKAPAPTPKAPPRPAIRMLPKVRTHLVELLQGKHLAHQPVICLLCQQALAALTNANPEPR